MLDVSRLLPLDRIARCCSVIWGMDVIKIEDTEDGNQLKKELRKPFWEGTARLENL